MLAWVKPYCWLPHKFLFLPFGTKGSNIDYRNLGGDMTLEGRLRRGYGKLDGNSISLTILKSYKIKSRIESGWFLY